MTRKCDYCGRPVDEVWDGEWHDVDGIAVCEECYHEKKMYMETHVSYALSNIHMDSCVDERLFEECLKEALKKYGVDLPEARWDFTRKREGRW